MLDFRSSHALIALRQGLVSLDPGARVESRTKGAICDHTLVQMNTADGEFGRHRNGARSGLSPVVSC
jgi:hypothetical protein